MRSLYRTENLTKANFLIVKNSSSYDYISAHRTSVDCIVHNPVKYPQSRFVSGIGDNEMWITIDFLSSKVSLTNYKILYAGLDRIMINYTLFGEFSPGKWEEIDNRYVKKEDIQNFTLENVKHWCYNYQVKPKRNYSKFKIQNFGINYNESYMTLIDYNEIEMLKAVTLAKLLFYGTIYPGKVDYSKINFQQRRLLILKLSNLYFICCFISDEKS